MSDLLEQRIAHERSWAYARWLERMSWQQIRIAASLPPEDGGLGYDLSPQALKGLVQQARADAGDMTMSRDERLERQLHETDARARAARHDLERALELTRTPAPRREDFYDLLEHAAAMGNYAKLIEAAGKAVESAERRLEVASERESKLMGLNAATKIEADVVHHDAVLDELNAMMLRAGRKPVTAE